MQTAPLVLVSCSICHQLHEPHPPADDANPLCARCTPLARRPQSFGTRPLER